MSIFPKKTEAMRNGQEGASGESAPKPARKKSKKRRRRAIVAVCLVAVLAGSFLLLRPSRADGSAIAYGDTTVLAYSDFSNTISATGTVESASSVMVYSTLSYVVSEISVSVGDYVEQGQLLARLDEQGILDQIESQEASLSASAASSAQQIKSAQDNYDQYKYALENGLNTSVNSAEAQVETSHDNYIKAVNTYERYRDGLDEGENSTLLTQESSLRNAETSLDNAESAYSSAVSAYNAAHREWVSANNALVDAKKALEDLEAARTDALANDAGADVSALDAEIAEARAALPGLESAEAAKRSAMNSASAQVDSASRSYDNAEAGYDTALSQYSATVSGVDNTLADYATAVETAYKSYQNALVSLEAARLSAENQLKSYENSLSSAQTSANNASAQVKLRQLRVDLESTAITAPSAGTVTAVYAKIGSSGSGLLFVIEDVDDLVVETTVKEYDVGTVEAGMPVSIRSDATGSRVYDGVIASIAPTSKKTGQGTTDTSGDVVFETEVKVSSKNTGLRIGMSVRLSYIVDQQDHVLSVPYDAVYTNAGGAACVLVVEAQPDGTHVLRELRVTAGLENDLSIVISGEGVTEGLRVVNEPGSYRALTDRPVSLSEASAPAAVSGFPFAGN